MVQTSVLLAIGLAFLLWPIWEDRSKRKREERRARRNREFEIQLAYAVGGRDAMMRMLLLDLRQVKVRRIYEDVIDEGGDVQEMLKRLAALR